MAKSGTAVPAKAALKKSFGDSFSAYEEILNETREYHREWKYYGDKHGWQLKVMNKGKALLYLIPRKVSFMVAFGVREAEREALLESDLSQEMKEALASAKKYPEGYPLRVEVRRKDDMRSVRVIINALKKARE